MHIIEKELAHNDSTMGAMFNLLISSLMGACGVSGSVTKK